FNPLRSSDEISEEPEFAAQEIRYLECGDRDTEIRTIVREIKRLVLTEDYRLADCALVVRKRGPYAYTIGRVLAEESLPCNLELRIDAGDIPANRAALKLLTLLEGLTTDSDEPATRISELADLIKSEYFRLSDAELKILSARFEEQHGDLLQESRIRLGFWDADALENAFAYVGSDLTVS